MDKPTIGVKRRLLFVISVVMVVVAGLIGRVIYIQTIEAESLQEMAYEQQTRNRVITPTRGSILDRNGVGIAVTESVTAVSVIHAQIEDEEQVARFLSEKLEMDYDYVLEKVSKKVALERIKTKVDKGIATQIRLANLPGVVVDEDVKRIYPYSNLAAQVIGFVGKDNQGIIGLEAIYDEYLKGEPGKILTLTDSRGIEIGTKQERIEPVNGGNLVISIDVVIQQYAEQILAKTVEAKEAKRGIIIVLNPQNGEIYAMANYPDFNLNEPFKINNEDLALIWDSLSEEEQNEELNRMWRNTAINDTYEPGSTFKMITSAIGLEEGKVGIDETFVCTGSHVAGDRTIKCWRFPRTHGVQSFVEGVQNSCNPVFMIVAERIGSDNFYDYMERFGLYEKTGVDLPGEAAGIMHKKENIGPVELATVSFGQSFQITPLQLLRAASAIVNGGDPITPHFAVKIVDDDGITMKEFDYPKGEQIVSKETSETMKYILENVVQNGSGNRTYIPGYRIGGKTATSEKLPRGNGKYISSFMAFAPAENPQVMAFVLIDEPTGVYYGGTVAGPTMKELMENILPYIGIEPTYNEIELEMDEIIEVIVIDLTDKTINEAKNELLELGLECEIRGEGETVVNQFPTFGEVVNKGTKIIVYTQ